MRQMVNWITSPEKTDYLQACETMERYVLDIQENKTPEHVWFLEHTHLYTMGTSGSMTDIPDPGGVPLYQTGRGGKITYHGPGQRIGYVMLDLNKRGKDLRQYIHNLEEWLILSLFKLGIKAERRAGRVGLWVIHPTKGESKIAAIGVRIRKWVTFHGFSLNIDPDLTYFQRIIPCGIREYGVTSFKDMGYDISMDQADQILKQTFSEVFK